MTIVIDSDYFDDFFNDRHFVYNFAVNCLIIRYVRFRFN